MLNSITANDLKIQGASVLNKILSEQPEVAITLRGKPKYIVMPIEQYNHYREAELVAALAETQADLMAGRVHKESIAEHIKRVKPTCSP